MFPGAKTGPSQYVIPSILDQKIQRSKAKPTPALAASSSSAQPPALAASSSSAQPPAAQHFLTEQQCLEAEALALNPTDTSLLQDIRFETQQWVGWKLSYRRGSPEDAPPTKVRGPFEEEVAGHVYRQGPAP